MFKKQIEQLKKERLKVKRDRWGYDDINDIDQFRKKQK